MQAAVLQPGAEVRADVRQIVEGACEDQVIDIADERMVAEVVARPDRRRGGEIGPRPVHEQAIVGEMLVEEVPARGQGHRHRHIRRSEEHTSELQSLMRISYAVLCLKKKKNIYKRQKHKATKHIHNDDMSKP